ncbi:MULTISPECIES: ABC transporter permease subunit [unclassified Ensifer]|uniref:amino acid ABC transporter permease n=1 Tax=unclassified Ensifer TaxID=2633371 RepID=UPI00081357AB|nr:MULTISPECIES: ABC transporter permease subunit [unclassified Ensifer]OCO98435.1 amino acid ABC transporter permease [Ensifer sp. LC11]OCP05586.1 amino acid ABC transporter permease [Ensifer sp. LC13]OCP13541.1 amino acid ABC transporter permease [Ensifer sp. LC14]OCP30756.1 amino acid ABC transporter permease [Ensifer sp. LC499]
MPLLFYDARIRAYLYQMIAIGAVLFVAWVMFSTASANLAKQDIATGFGFLARQAGFVITESAIAYEPTDTIGRAILVGITNTVKVSLLAALFGTILGLLVGIGRLSHNPVLSRLMLAYVEALRNVPLLLYLLLWYSLIISAFPPVKQAIEMLPGVFLSNSGLVMPALRWESGFTELIAALVVGLAGAALAARVLGRRRVLTGKDMPIAPCGTLAFVLPLAAVFLVANIAVSWDVPELGRFRLSGGYHLRPEFVALLLGLTLSVSANVAEIVRAGIQAVSKGQWEAATALGLSRGRTLKLVILPQALRIIIPPLTNTYLTVFKNSSLAIAIGYPDLVMVSNTVMNQTGQAIEAIAIFMGVYLGLSILISLVMNWYNARVALRER